MAKPRFSFIAAGHVRAARGGLRLSADKLAEMAGVSRVQLALWESGKIFPSDDFELSVMNALTDAGMTFCGVDNATGDLVVRLSAEAVEEAERSKPKQAQRKPQRRQQRE